MSARALLLGLALMPSCVSVSTAIPPDADPGLRQQYAGETLRCGAHAARRAIVLLGGAVGVTAVAPVANVVAPPWGNFAALGLLCGGALLCGSAAVESVNSLLYSLHADDVLAGRADSACVEAGLPPPLKPEASAPVVPRKSLPPPPKALSELGDQAPLEGTDEEPAGGSRVIPIP